MKTLWIYRKTTELVDLYHLKELTVSFVKTANEMAQTAKGGPNIQRKQIPTTVMSAQYSMVYYFMRQRALLTSIRKLDRQVIVG